MTNVLTNPNQFFGELSARDTNLKTPFLIVLIAAIVGAISSAITMSAVISSLPKEVAVITSIFAVIGAIIGLIMPFIGWLLYAGVFYAISMLFKGTGSFKRVFEFVGYGFIPTIIGAVIGLAATLAVPPTIEFLPDTHPLTLAATIIQILLLLWSANIWIFGIKHARNLSTKHAIITVLGIPAVFCLLWGIAMIYLYTSGI
jgi:hypothetical protein